MSNDLLIFRPDNIGDVLLFSGALRHLREHYPGRRIALAVRRPVMNLVERCPHVDEVIPVESFQYWPNVPEWFFGIRGVPRLTQCGGRLRMAAVPPHWNTIIAPVRSPFLEHVRLIDAMRAGEKIGTSGDRTNRADPDRLAAFLTRCYPLDPALCGQHELDYTASFLQWMGIPAGGRADVWPEFWLSEDDEKFARMSVSPAKGATLALLPGASAPEKMWPVERYGAALANLPEIRRIVVLGGPAEKPLGQRLREDLSSAGREILDLTGKTTLRQFVACLARADFSLACDSFGLHAAIALKRPVVALTLGGHGGRFMPWAEPALCRLARTPPAPSFSPETYRAESREFLDSISAEAVTACLRETLKTLPTGRGQP